MRSNSINGQSHFDRNNFVSNDMGKAHAGGLKSSPSTVNLKESFLQQVSLANVLVA